MEPISPSVIEPNEPNGLTQKVLTLSSNPKHRGAFFTEDATSKDLALVTAKYKDVKIYWLVDPNTDLIYDAKFFSYGGPLSIAMGEILCSLVRGMKMETACEISGPEVESLLRDSPDLNQASPFPAGSFANLPMLLATALETFPSSKALALAATQLKIQGEQNRPSSRKEPYVSANAADHAWLKKSKEEQLLAIEDVLTRDIRPGLNSDGGDLLVTDLEEGTRLHVKYQGACGSCGSSTGATLSFIEDTMRRNIYGGLQVIPAENPAPVW